MPDVRTPALPSIPRAQLATAGQAAAKGSVILSAWRNTRERERMAQRAADEQRAAMAQLRSAGQGGHWTSRRSAVAQAAARAADMPQAAFDVVSGVAQGRSFDAAATDRLTAGWGNLNTSINADLERGLPALRARSRGWCVNTDMGRRYIELCEDNIVGADGMRLQVRATLGADDKTPDEAANAAIEQHWQRWCARADITGRSFNDTLKGAVACLARDGEFLVRRIRDRSLPYGYGLQLLDVDRIWTGGGGLAATMGDNIVRLGVEIDRIGRKQALHLYSAHPGDGAMGLAPKPIAERVTVDTVFHDFIRKRPEQLRGYPWTAAVLRAADMLHQYKESALVASKIGASKMGFYTIDKDAPTTEMSVEDYRDATGNLVQDVEAGMVEALPPGVGFESFDPDYPQANYAPFVNECGHSIASGLDVAHHNLTGNMSGVNYSSARIAELKERDSWRSKQRWLIDALVRPVFEEWLRCALLTRSITFPSGSALPADRFDKFAQAATFQPRSWAWVDPQADITAAVTAIDNRLRSHRQVAAESGVDLDTVLHDEAAFRTACAAAQLPEKAPQPAQPTVAADPATTTPATP